MEIEIFALRINSMSSSEVSGNRSWARRTCAYWRM